MRVVNISLDPKVLDPKSVASYRNRFYGEVVDHYSVVVHDRKDTVLKLTSKVTVYGVGGGNKIVRLFRIGKLLNRLAKEGKCDVITSSDPYYLGAVSYMVAKINHIGYEAHILGLEKMNLMRKSIAKFIVKKAGAVRVNSTRLRERVSKEFGVSLEKISFVPIHVPTHSLGLKLAEAGSKEREEQDRLDKEFGDKYGDYFNLIFVGRLVEVKNVAMQIKALAEIKKHHEKIRLHIIGEGPLQEQLTELSRKFGLDSEVIFHGRKDGLKLGSFYRQADCFVLTSFSEGWPQVVYESMVAGTCVVMTDVGCAGEMIKHEKNGLVVPVDDYQALAEALLRLINDLDLKNRLVETATENIKNYWTHEQILRGYQESWKKAMNNKL